VLPVTVAARLVACTAAAYGMHKRAAEPPRRNLQTESTIRQAHTIDIDADRTRIAGGASLCREAAAAAVHLGAARVHVCLARRSARGELPPLPSTNRQRLALRAATGSASTCNRSTSAVRLTSWPALLLAFAGAALCVLSSCILALAPLQQVSGRYNTIRQRFLLAGHRAGRERSARRGAGGVGGPGAQLPGGRAADSARGALRRAVCRAPALGGGRHSTLPAGRAGEC